MEGIIDQEKFIEVMYNGRYGVFSFSEEAISLYCEHMGLKRKDFNEQQIDRHDANMLEIVKDLGKRANGQFCNIMIRTIPKEYKDFYRIIVSLSCPECVRIDYKGYKLARIGEILSSHDLPFKQKQIEILYILNLKNGHNSESEDEYDSCEDYSDDIY